MTSQRLDQNASKELLKDPTPLRNKPSFTASVLQIKQAGNFDKFTHKPPRIDHNGYNKETHKGKELLNKHTKNAISEATSIPKWWNHSTTNEMNI